MTKRLSMAAALMGLCALLPGAEVVAHVVMGQRAPRKQSTASRIAQIDAANTKRARKMAKRRSK